MVTTISPANTISDVTSNSLLVALACRALLIVIAKLLPKYTPQISTSTATPLPSDQRR